MRYDKIKNPDFALPARKVLFKSDMEYELVLIDATAPKKDKKIAIIKKIL